jgi:hypothetical protein
MPQTQLTHPREDPLGLVCDSEVVPLLKTDVHSNAVTLLEELQRRYPGHWDNSVLRTFQLRLRLWRAQFPTAILRN